MEELLKESLGESSLEKKLGWKRVGWKKYETRGLSMIKWIVEVEGKLMCLEMFRIYFL